MSEMYTRSTLIGIAIIGVILGGAIGYGGSVLLSDTGGGDAFASGTLKAGFIYVGPIGDYGWTNAHDVARVMLDDKYDWLETNYFESVPEGEARSSIEFLIEDWGADVVFTTSFGFMDQTIEIAAENPDTIFFHVSGFKRAPNVGTMFADFYQLYYLNGLMAGALTESDKIGYVAAFPIPELIRHINAYHLGATTINPDIETHVRWMLTDWYDPATARNAAEELVTAGVDMLAFTEDSISTVEVANETDDVYVFSHYSPMQRFAPQSTISGQLVHWEVLYETILQKIFTGQYNTTNLENVDILGLLKEGAVELGGAFGDAINDPFEDDLKEVMVDDPELGEISVYDLVFERMAQMEQTNVVFEPFTGPLYAQNGTLMVPDDIRMTIPELLTMNWFLGTSDGCTIDAGCVVGSTNP